MFALGLVSSKRYANLRIFPHLHHDLHETQISRLPMHRSDDGSWTGPQHL